MIAIVERVKRASVRTDVLAAKEIGKGLVVLLGIAKGDNLRDIRYCVKKILNLRIFDDKDGIMNLSIKDIQGSILLISQFTLLGDVHKGNRPSYIKAAGREKALPLYNEMLNLLGEDDINVLDGCFGEEMFIDKLCHGPVTIIIDSIERKKEYEKS